jgi:hypothetical protein
MASDDEVELLLTRFRQMVDSSNCELARRYYVKPDGTRIFYLEALLDLDLTEEEAYSVIRSLRVSDYRKGPEEDRKFPEQGLCIWVFKMTVKGKRAYVKLKITEQALVLSLHEDW